MKRNVLSVVAGVILAGVVIMVVQGIGHHIYPLPQGVDPKDVVALQKIVGHLPLGAFLFVLGAYLLGTVVGVFAACSIAKEHKTWTGSLVGGILLILGIINLVMIPHPLWFNVACVSEFVVATAIVVWWKG